MQIPKLLLLFAFSWFFWLKGSGQAAIDNADAARQIQLAQEALDSNQPDSLVFYLQKAREIYLQTENWDSYYADFTKIPPAAFSKWDINITFVEKGIQFLQHLRQDMQDRFFQPDTRELEINYQIARGFYYQGLALKNQDEHAFYAAFDSCFAYTKQNLAQLEKMPPDETALIRANHYNLLGVALNAGGDAASALEEFQKVLLIRSVKLSPEDDRLGSIYFNLGNAYSNLKVYNKALDAYIKGIKIREKVLGVNRSSLANMYFNVGAMYDEKGEYDNAIMFYNRAAEIYHANPNDFNDLELRVADILNKLAGAYQDKGAYQESAVYNQQSIQKYEQLGGDNTEKIADVYTNQALLTGLKGNYQQAVELNEKALQLYQQKLPPTHPRVIQALNNLGIAYADNGAYDRAMTTLQGALQEIEKEADQQEMIANLNSEIGNVYFKTGKLAEAKAYNLKALEILQKIFQKKSYKIAAVYNTLAKIAEAEKHHQQALQYLQQALGANHAYFEGDKLEAIPTAKGYFRYDYFVESLMLQTAFLRKDAASNYTALLTARSIYLVADSVLMQVQDELIRSEDKILLSEKIYKVSQGAIENCVHLAEATSEPRFYEEAFAYAEKSKNTVLTQSITANQALHFVGIPDSLLALENRLQSDIRYYTLKLSEQPDSASSNRFQNELFAAQKLYRALIQELEEEFPLYYQLKYDRSVPTVSAIQSVLPEQTALVSYFVGDSILYSFVITKKDFKVYRSALGMDFYNQQIGIRKSITWQLNEDYVALAHRLYEQLFPFSLDKSIESLIIIPDGTLSKLPFEALLTQQVNPRSAINFSQLPYLLNDYQISYALSGALFYQHKFSPPAADETNGGLLAYAPVFAEPQKVGFYANGLRNPLAEIDGSVGRTTTLDGQYVAALPATADEVQSIAAVFQQKGQQTSTFLFQNANENQLKRSDMSHSKYIHIATHGFINEAQPDLSGLLLFPDSTEAEDHILYSGEVYSLNLHANLVVLSACETGLGKVANGEGLLGLSRAFFYAGAENLLVSLWKVQDQATADLMVSFYQAHLNGDHQQFAVPLRQAKLDMIRSATFNHPYFWSAFVLIGR